MADLKFQTWQRHNNTVDSYTNNTIIEEDNNVYGNNCFYMKIVFNKQLLYNENLYFLIYLAMFDQKCGVYCHRKQRN